MAAYGERPLRSLLTKTTHECQTSNENLEKLGKFWIFSKKMFKTFFYGLHSYKPLKDAIKYSKLCSETYLVNLLTLTFVLLTALV